MRFPHLRDATVPEREAVAEEQQAQRVRRAAGAGGRARGQRGGNQARRRRAHGEAGVWRPHCAGG